MSERRLGSTDPAGSDHSRVRLRETDLRPASYYVRDGAGHMFTTLTECTQRFGAIGCRIADLTDRHGIVLNPDRAAPMPAIERVTVLANS
jgi:hypothetical protein